MHKKSKEQYLDVFEVTVELVHFGASLLEDAACPEHGGVILHGFLHIQTQLGSRNVAVGETDLVQIGNRLLSRCLQWTSFYITGVT
jgi:hypothetical protein